MPPRAQVQAVRSSSTMQLTASSALASSNATNAGLVESHPHDINITKEAPNYSMHG